MQLTWGDKLIERGRQEGIKKGLKEGRREGRREGRKAGALEAKREILLELMVVKFGPLPRKVAVQVKALDSARKLNTCLRRLLSAKSLKEMKVSRLITLGSGYC